MEFAVPHSALPFWLSVIAALLVAIVIALRAFERQRRGRLGRFVEAGLASRLLVGYDTRIRRPLGVLTVLGFGFLALSLLQPHWGEAWQAVRQVSRDVLIVLDTSESMRATNPLPSRIERAKQEIAALLDKAPGDRFGLIAFSGAAALQCPLTLDHGYFKAVLSAVDTDTISREGTDIAAALEQATALFVEEEALSADYDRNARAVLLISDGEQVSGDAVDAAKALAEYARIFVIGVGDPAGTVVQVPEWMESRRAGTIGNETHVSVLDEDTLMRVAAAGNGAYTRSQVDSWDIDQLYERFKALSARDVEGDVHRRMVNRYQWFLAAAFVCFAGEGLWLVLMPWVRHWRMGRTRSTAAAGNVERVS